MKKYKVVKNENGHMDLINVEDAFDRIMCSIDFDAMEEAIVSESEFYIEENQYVDDQGFGVAPFAFLKEDTQVQAYNQAAKEHMIASISFALDFIEANSYPTDEIDAMQEGLRDALNFINSLEP